MRIVVVSAHYPPNFVSGGTLVPQRLARGLAGRGHDVWVYAGSLDPQRKALETWQDQDPTGLPVRWIASWPWIGWSDRHNYDNPAVTADFTAWLAEVRPDVVHLHSLQSLGCGLVEAAAATGAAVVVTMHDFWWICARQFLADRSYRPCCLVVAAGTCQCEVTREWLDGRTARLDRALAAADLVLVPSSVTAAVLTANGVAPERVVVDENGLPPRGAGPPGPDVVDAVGPAAGAGPAGPAGLAAGAGPGGPAAGAGPAGPAGPAAGAGPAGPAGPGGVDGTVVDVPGKDAPLRLLYAGGRDRMKGSDVLVAAATELADRRGWRMTAYGLDPATVPSGLPVEVKAPFAEDDLTAVLSGTDVLVVPSVMRETFSILTREALLCGVPVVTSDTLGPEEVVFDGHNGLVVPAADPRALAHAIGRLLDDPALLARLRNGAAAVAVRSIEDQVSANEARYQKLIHRPAADRERQGRSAACPPGIRNVVFAVGIEGAPLRYRARLPAEGLALLGVETSVVHYRDPALPALLASADAAVFYRVPATTNVLELIATTRDRGCPVLFDVDDLIFDPDLAKEIPALSILPPAEAELWLQGVRRYRTTMEACDAFVGSTDQLCRHAAAVTGMPVERFSNGVGLLLGRLSDQALRARRAKGPPRIGYFSGTTTHDRDWAEIEATVLDAMDRHLDLELWLVGHLKTSPEVARHRHRIRTWPMMPWTEIPAMLRNVDLNLVPLELGSRFNEAKSAIKWLEASLVATPTIASPTQPFREVIDPGVTGFLASTPTDWGEAIDRLIRDPDHLERVGARARRSALLEWAPHIQGRRYLAMLERTIEQTGRGEKRRPTIDWLPVALEEPPVAGQLEPYGLTPATSIEEPPGADRAVTLPPVATRVTNLLRRGLESQRRDGTAVTLRRALRLLERHTVGFRDHLRRLVRRPR